MLRRAEDRWVHRCLFHHFCGRVCYSLTREVTSRGHKLVGWGESIPRTHRKPEEVSAFNSSPCLTGKWVKPLTSDAKEKSLTSDAKEKSLTSDAKERCLHPALLHLWEGLPSLGKEPPFCVLTGNSVWKSQERRRQAVGSPDRERDAPCLQPPQPPPPSQPSASFRPSRIHSQDSLPWALPNCCAIPLISV